NRAIEQSSNRAIEQSSNRAIEASKLINSRQVHSTILLQEYLDVNFYSNVSVCPLQRVFSALALGMARSGARRRNERSEPWT
ncbi:hypothetical protein, partial [uncultured Treponema sp.]|uniref:hypothetical protein n=1 Tax=uncultured Treponema sp. TaxID=162155 RepID=UPI002606A1AB